MKLFLKVYLLIAVLLLLSPSVRSVWKNACTNGKDNAFMTIKTYMKEFAAGPCSPTVILPGILGSVLRVEITNCEKFRAFDNVTFSNCNWTSCTGPGSPDKEYQIWVTAIGSPMSLLQPNETSKACFAGLAEMSFDNSSGKFIPISKPGLKLSPHGYTAQTSGKAFNCGTKGIENLLPGITNPEGTEYFKAFAKRLEEMGYRSGLTMQALPYDFRLSSGYDLISKNLPIVIKLLKEFTNKRVVIAAHSMGNMKTAYALWGMTQQEKDDNIQLYLAIAPPLMGAAKPISFLTCGSTDFFFPFNLGIDMKTWKRFAGKFPSVFELFPTPTYTSQLNQPWMQKILSRIQYEKGETTDPVFSFLPTRDKKCFNNFNQSQCNLGLEVFDNYASYMGMRIDNTNLLDWMTNHTFSDYSNKDQMYSFFDKRFETLPNINVPAVMVFSNVVPTEGKYVFNQDPKITASQDKFCGKDDMNWHPWPGDDTVPSTSILTPGLKWSMEYLEKAQNAKPIKLLNVCSSYNVKNTPYDGNTVTGSKSMNQVEYQGLPCDCSEGKYRHCTHIGMLHNPALIDYYSNTLLTKDIQPVSKMVEKMNELELISFHETCQILQSTLSSEATNAEDKKLSSE